MISPRAVAILICLLGLQHAGAAIVIGDFVWNDTDGDGVQDAGEPGVAGVTVQLWNAAKNDLLSSTTTNSSGAYALEASGPGGYRVRFLLPNSAIGFSPANATTDSADSDVFPSGTDFGFTAAYTLSSGTTSIDCGLIPDPMGDHNIGDRVFNANASGTQTGTTGISGVTVQLKDSSGAVLQTTTTNADGNYSFLASPGTYRLHFLSPAGKLPTPLKDQGGDEANDSDIDENGNTPLFSISGSTKLRTLDAGFVYATTVGNLVWSDADEDGIQDTVEPGIPGVTVQIWNDALNDLIGSTTTNASGNYSLVVPNGFSYRVRVLPKYPGDRITLKDVGADNLKDNDFNPSGAYAGFTDTLVLPSNVISITSVDAGIVEDPMKDHNIGDQVFRATATGLQGGGTVSGVRVELYNSSGFLAETTSTPNGFYSFKAVPGSYRLRFITPLGMVPSPHPNAGGDNDLDSDIDENGFTGWFTVSSGGVRRDLDAGFVYLVSVGNLVWHDVNSNGVQDGGEEGVPSVEVELWDAAKSERLDAAVTNANGIYGLKAPGPGDYRIWALRPMGTDSFSTKDADAGNLLDSDVNPDGVDFGFTDPFAIASNVISITSLDIGMTFTGNATTRTVTPFLITGLRRDSANWLIDYQGPVLGTYAVETTTDLKSWETVGTPFISFGATGTRSVALTPSVRAKYFRLRRTR